MNTQQFMSMNLVELKPSRKNPQPGDVFVYMVKQKPNQFWFGQVIRIDSSVGPFKNTILIYLFNHHSTDKHNVPVLSFDALLVPPIHTNKLPWTKGCFETVKNIGLVKEHLLPYHHFRDAFGGRVFDADSRPVTNPGPVLGEYGLDSFKTIDDSISKALGIPLFKE